MNRFTGWALIALASAVPAQAQQTSPAAPGQPRGERPDFAAMQARRADDLMLLLNLTPAQKPKLVAFLESARPPQPPEPPKDGAPPAGPEAPSFAEKLDRMEKHQGEQAAREHDWLIAARAFYTGLTADQRARFEAVERLSGPRPGPGGPGGPHGPGGKGPGRPGGPGGPDGEPDGPPPQP